MGRKNLLKELIESSTSALGGVEGASEDRPRYAKGAIGAVGRSIAELKSRALADIDPELIDAGGMADRLEADDEADAALMASIRDYGQQVPVLVRPHPETPGRFQIVYGRRRVLALRALGQPVKALIRDLDDRELVIAQGQENAARRDLSFIEKANFARQLRDAGYDRKIVCDALHIDKTALSRMLSVADRLPPEVLRAIGSGPGIGRDRWLLMADRFAASNWAADKAVAFVAESAGASEARFETLMKALTPPARPPRAAAARDAPIVAENGAPLGRLRRRAGGVVLTLDADENAARFGEWLAERLTEIHRDWQNRRGE